MNTTLKGDIFEKRVFELIQELLKNEEYYLSGKNSRIFAKKKYYSEAREKDIIVDISIESYIPNSEKYSLLNIIECKNLGKNVTPDDIEEFDSKLRQIGGHNTTGTMFSNYNFSKTTINIAKKFKIGLVRIKSDNQLEWINYRKVDINITSDSEINDNEPFIGFINKRIITNIADYLLEYQIIDIYKHKEKYLKIPYLTEDYIEKVVSRLYAYDIHDNYTLNNEKLCKFISSKYPVIFDFTNSENGVLGKIEFNPLKIYVNPNQDENRFRFTLCHEIGHLIFHSNILKNRIEYKTDDDYSFSLKYNVHEKNNRRLEFQANIFASHFLLPKDNFLLEVMKYFIQNDIHKNYLYLDKQHTNYVLVFSLITLMSEKFKVSNEVVKIRLIGLGLLKDKTDFSFRKLLRDLTY